MACDPQLQEPDLTLNLEICDMINQKQKSAPHEAAMYIARFVGDSDRHVSMLALNLLDVCVKNCGFAFHLQVASKEFLNQLVVGFPERPPKSLSAVQEKILDLLQQWNFVIYSGSKYADDLVHINDMYRLLQSKGYRFPSVKQSDTDVMNLPKTLRSEEEEEEEERQVHSAKLQEYIRRGTPSDLAAANDLMQIMVGYQTPNSKSESHKVAAVPDVDRLMNLLNNLSGDKNVEEIQNLVTKLKDTQAKLAETIERKISQGSTDVERLLEENDTINNAVLKFEEVSRGVSKEEPLIDFGDEGGNRTTDEEQSSKKNSDLIAELSGLDLSQNSVTERPSIRLDPTSQFWTQRKMDPASLTMINSSTAIPTGSNSLISNDIGNNGSLPTKETTETTFSIPSNAESGVLHESNGVKAIIKYHSENGSSKCECYFSNQNSTIVKNLKFEVAVPKDVKLMMEPITSQVLPPQSVNSSLQSFKILGLPTIRFKFRISYSFNDENFTESGQFGNK